MEDVISEVLDATISTKWKTANIAMEAVSLNFVKNVSPTRTRKTSFKMNNFFTGLHQPSDVKHFDKAFVSINRLRNRRGPFPCEGAEIIIDSAAFSELSRDQELDEEGKPIPNDYRNEVSEYASQVVRWDGMIRESGGKLLAAVSQDYMCEPFILEKTGFTKLEHQEKTIARYDELLRCDTGVYIMPVLQGYDPKDYVHHIAMYGPRLTEGMWVGVGSVCKRNGDPRAIEAVLMAIHRARPDLKLHGFGLKSTALKSGIVDQLLWSADSMAWSYQARMRGNGNDWHEAKRWGDKIKDRWIQRPLFIPV
jgi:hypothetical protein